MNTQNQKTDIVISSSDSEMDNTSSDKSASLSVEVDSTVSKQNVETPHFKHFAEPLKIVIK